MRCHSLPPMRIQAWAITNSQFGRSTMRCYVCCLGGSSDRAHDPGPRPRSASQSSATNANTNTSSITSLRCIRTAEWHTCRLPVVAVCLCAVGVTGEHPDFHTVSDVLGIIFNLSSVLSSGRGVLRRYTSPVLTFYCASQ